MTDRRTPVLTATSVLATIAVALCVFYFVYGTAPKPTGLTRGEMNAATESARQAAVDVYSYNYQTIQKQFATVSKELTGGFLTQFKTEESSIASAYTSSKATSTTQVLDSGTVPSTSDGPNKTSILVAVEIDYMPGGGTPTPETELLQLDLIRSGKAWLVENIETVE